MNKPSVAISIIGILCIFIIFIIIYTVVTGHLPGNGWIVGILVIGLLGLGIIFFKNDVQKYKTGYLYRV
jgi:hypothetical protein